MARPITSVADLRALARRRVPRMFYDYCDSGSWTESTYRANEADFVPIKLRQRVGIDVRDRTLKTTMAGVPVSMPVALAPTGMTGMQHADGEILAARAAEKAGVPFTLSTMSICSIEDVAGSTTSPFWFQLYVMRDRDFTRDLIDRAKAARCSALVLTLDLAILAQRHKDIVNGLSAPPRMTIANLINLATKPRWCVNMLGTKRRTFGNIIGHVKNVSDLKSLATWMNERRDPTLSWDDVKWIKERWGGKLILKGVLDPEDAEKAVQTGADALIVSNHGGRQLDGAKSSIAALPAIAAAVGDRIEVLMDGGVRSGQDVIKALALGAKGVFIGRAFLYGLGAMGEAGVTSCLDVIRKELDMTMALCGLRDIRDVGRNILEPSSPGRMNGRRKSPARFCLYRRKEIQTFRKEIQAGWNKFQIRRNEIQIQIIRFPSPYRAFSMAYADPHSIFYAASGCKRPWQRRRTPSCFVGSSVFVSGFSGLVKQVKGWRRLSSRTRWRRFRPTCRPRSLIAKKGTLVVPGPAEDGGKDRPIDPTSGKNTSASPSPIRFRANGQADGRQPFMPLRVSHDPCLQNSSLRFAHARRMRPLSVGRVKAPFIQRQITTIA